MEPINKPIYVFTTNCELSNEAAARVISTAHQQLENGVILLAPELTLNVIYDGGKLVRITGGESVSYRCPVCESLLTRDGEQLSGGIRAPEMTKEAQEQFVRDWCAAGPGERRWIDDGGE